MLRFLELLSDDQVVRKLKSALYPQALSDKLDTLTQTIAGLASQLEIRESQTDGPLARPHSSHNRRSTKATGLKGSVITIMACPKIQQFAGNIHADPLMKTAKSCASEEKVKYTKKKDEDAKAGMKNRTKTRGRALFQKLRLTNIGADHVERYHRLGPKQDGQGRSRKQAVSVRFRSDAV
ncbi:hypothetical protein NP493_631g00005 [Ridgeia piscesae]|uniref:Uncharacterized protein n=1 Tax=Ridgeia piscesae TaxID=27915 RepID=A0AAD9KT04_RIDPI|nr:hypothetical protein NP493_631g00005 [Ridgeia piscesae]